ncbi:DUF4179 domain-containing protein [Paenibacillus glucanolyticus]|uniref:DUF4179 domain-containing protein n=1 Tax=Paenibacillus glucanolyticus TaxID=59843 RepID=UPI0030C9FBDA
MFEKEERMLKEMNKSAEVSTEAVTDEALDAAVRSGMRRGRRHRQLRARLVSFSAVMVTVAAALLLAVWGGDESGLKPKEQMAAQGPYPPLTGFDFGEDITLNTANKYGMIQPVNQSVTKGDYTVTVNGVLVGSQRMDVFYTVQNMAEDPADLKRVVLKHPGSSDSLPYSVGSSGGNKLAPGVLHRSQLDVQTNEDTPLPQELTFSFILAPYSTNTVYESSAENEQVIDINVSIDVQTAQKYLTTIPINKMLQIEKQRFYLKEAVLSPAGIVVKANIPSSNTMKVSGLWGVYLETVVNGEKIRLNSDSAFLPGAGGGDMTYFFESNILEKPESIMLKADGFQAVDPSTMQLVVDTEKGKVIRSPDGDIQFGEYTKHMLTLEYEERADRHMGSVSIEPEFVDGEGNKHMINEDAGGVNSSSYSSSDTGISRITQYIYLKPQEYPQPLTFTLSSYPGVMEQAFEVPIQ